MISQKDIEALARGADMSSKAIRLFIGSNNIAVKKDKLIEDSVVRLELGLNILQKDVLFDPSLLKVEIPVSLNEYARVAPKVYAWVKGGGFNPSVIPERITYANLVHACRTVSRVRAILMRSCTYQP